LGGLAVLVLLAVLGGSADADRLSDKRAEATRVQNELDQMDTDLAKAIEAYDAAQTRLDATEAAIRENELELGITRKNLAIAQSDLTSQLVADYRSGSPDTIGVLLGAASISDMLARVDIIKRSSGHTAQLVGKVLTFKKQIETTSKKLANDSRRVLMIAYAAEVGDTPLLRTHLEALHSVAPEFIPSLFRGDYRPFHRLEHMAMLLDSLRKAGLGDC